jgi:hypothetical protein
VYGITDGVNSGTATVTVTTKPRAFADSATTHPNQPVNMRT